MLYLVALLAQAPTTSPAPAPGGGSALIVFLPLALAFYFLGVRPNQKRMRAQQELMRQISVGDEIETAAGFYGRVRAADDVTLDIELSPGVVVKMSRAAVRRRIVAPPDDTPGSTA